MSQNINYYFHFIIMNKKKFKLSTTYWAIDRCDIAETPIDSAIGSVEFSQKLNCHLISLGREEKTFHL